MQTNLSSSLFNDTYSSLALTKDEKQIIYLLLLTKDEKQNKSIFFFIHLYIGFFGFDK